MKDEPWRGRPEARLRHLETKMAFKRSRLRQLEAMLSAMRTTIMEQAAHIDCQAIVLRCRDSMRIKAQEYAASYYERAEQNREGWQRELDKTKRLEARVEELRYAARGGTATGTTAALMRELATLLEVNLPSPKVEALAGCARERAAMLEQALARQPHNPGDPK